MSRFLRPIGKMVPDFIKNRGWNLNPMWGTEHALVDPSRYQFMRSGWKATNPLPNAVERMWGRMPTSHKVTLIGGATAAGVYAVYKGAQHE